MKLPDGTSRQYIIYVKQKTLEGEGKGEERRIDQRYITTLGVEKWGFKNAKEFAMAIFHDPNKYNNIHGENWMGYKVKNQKKKLLMGKTKNTHLNLVTFVQIDYL